MEGNTRPFGELFAESTRNGLTRPKAVRGSGVKMVKWGNSLLTPGNFAIGGGFKGDKLKYYDGVVPEEFILHKW